MAECAYCGDPVDDGVSPDGEREFCSAQHAAKYDHSPDQPRQQAGLPGAAAASQAVASQDTDTTDQDDDHAAEAPDPPEPGEIAGQEPDESDTTPGFEAGKPASTGPGIRAWSADEVSDAISKLSAASPVVDTDGWPQPASTEGRPPLDLRERDLWLVWSPEFGKTPMAPWETGHCYPVRWGADADPRPETDYEQAKMVAEMPPQRIHDSYSFPPLDGEDEPHVPDEVLPTVYMPHDPPDPPIMLVDLDDVRDPETGSVSPEAMAIVRRLDSYTEVSSSGTGLHIYVRAALPGALGKFIGNLDMVGHIELYDHGRFVGATWDHLDGTPDDLAHVQNPVYALVERYENDAQRARRNGNARAGVGSSPVAKRAKKELSKVRERFGLDPDDESAAGDRRNAYYHDLDVERVARHGRYGSAYFTEREQQRGWRNGPHPGHGPLHSSVEECTNFGIKDSQWSCFAHDGGSGGALSLLAVVDSSISVRCGEAKTVHDDPAALLKTCLVAREEFAGLEDADPPYTALVGVAEQFDLSMQDSEEGILGKETKRVARKIYDELSSGEVENA